MNVIDHIQRVIKDAPDFSKAIEAVCADLRRLVPHYNWVGVYMVEADTLVLRAWNGPAATQHVRIPIGQGICGLAAREERTVVVDDVNKDPRYLACFLQTRAEIVVPIMKGPRCVGEIDIDSDKVAAFDELDRQFLEWTAARLAEKLPA